MLLRQEEEEEMRINKRFILVLFLVGVFLLAACGGGNTQPAGGNNAAGESETEVDSDTGLQINPLTDPGGQFIVEGPLDSVNLTPQTAPEFVVRITPEKTYRIRSQSLADTFFEDGEAVTPSAIRQGMMIRATIEFDPDLAIYRSDDLVFLNPES